MSSSLSSTPDFPNDHDDSPPPDSNINHAHSLAYWSDVPATVDGMLGGFSQVSRIDLQGSKAFFAKIKRLLSDELSTQSLAPRTRTRSGNGAANGTGTGAREAGAKLARGVDCGAGIGRITDGFLCEVCEVVDAVEPVEKFSSVLRSNREKKDAVPGDVYTVGLESWIPQKEYDLVWVQWCAGHLTDDQFVEFLQRCRQSLSRGGFVVVKENTTAEAVEEDDYDGQDSSVTRTHEKYMQLFDEAGMRVITTELQLGFPKRLGLLPVRFYALRPVG